MNLNKLTKFSALKKAVEFARLNCNPEEDATRYRALILGYYSAIEELGAIKFPRPEKRSREVGRKISSSKRKMIKQGLWFGGRVPFGYSAKNGKLVINHEEDEAVSMMVRLYAGGVKPHTISKRIFEKLGIKVSHNCVRKICTGQRVTPTH
jgi:hypothetical protein